MAACFEVYLNTSFFHHISVAAIL